jgi:hypothetical protein
MILAFRQLLIPMIGENKGMEFESTEHKKSKRKPIIITTAVTLLLIACVGGTMQKVHADQLNEAQKSYSTALKANKDEHNDLNASLQDTQAITTWADGDVKDPNALNKVRSANTVAVKESKSTVYKTLTTEGKDIDQIKDATNKLTKDTKAADTAGDNLRMWSAAATHSKYEKTVDNAKSGLTSTLKNANDLLSSSNGNVADNNVRQELQNSINSGNTSLNAKVSDVNGMNSNVNAINDSMNKVKSSQQQYAEQVAAAQAAAAAQASAARSQASSSSRSTTGTAKRTYTKTYTKAGRTYTRTYTSNGSYTSSADCTPNDADPVCQGAVDRGGLTHISYYGGNTNIYAQHNNTGGNRINYLTLGSTVTVNGRKYVVTSNNVNQTTAPSSGTYLQTCTGDGNGNRLVGLTPSN